MEEWNINETSRENINYSNRSFNFSDSFNQTPPYYDDDSGSGFAYQFLDWMNWITVGIGLPLTLTVIIAVFSQVKKDQGAPVYVINLLISDLIQLCSRIPDCLLSNNIVPRYIWIFCLLASVGFMVCISFERYLVIAWPLWYRFRRNIKTSVVVCIVVWALPFLVLLTVFMVPVDGMGLYIEAGFLLLPFPLFIFFLIGTIKALSGALSVPADEKQRIIAIQIVVLLIYTLLFLPFIVFLLLHESDFVLNLVAVVCICLSPLADTALYLFIRKSVLHKFLASLCCCEIPNKQKISSRNCESTTVPNTEAV